MDKYDEDIKRNIVNVKDIGLPMEDVPMWNQLSQDENDKSFTQLYQNVLNDKSIPEEDDRVDRDQYINMEVNINRGDKNGMERATVKRRALDVNGEPMGNAHKNPLLDSRQFEVEYIDGTIETLSANIIAESILAQIDDEGHRQLLLDEIVDHRMDKNAEIGRDQKNYKKISRTTKGWELCVRWKDRSTNWIPLKDMKNGFILETARYAINNRIDKEPAFTWWARKEGM